MWHWSAITKHTFINGAIMVFWVFRMFWVQFWSHLQADASSLLSAELVLVLMHYRNTQSCFEFFMSNDNALNRSNKMSKNWTKKTAKNRCFLLNLKVEVCCNLTKNSFRVLACSVKCRSNFKKDLLAYNCGASHKVLSETDWVVSVKLACNNIFIQH